LYFSVSIQNLKIPKLQNTPNILFMQVKTIIFDLGNVLIDWNPDYVFKKLIPDDEKRKYFFDNVCTMEWNIEQDAGRRLTVATEGLVKEHPEWEKEIRAYYDQWETMLGGPIQDTVDILKDLKDTKKYQILALTNWSAELFPIALLRYNFLFWFEGTVVSGDEMTKKPLSKIYQILIKRYSVDPSKAIFIDDSLKNIKGGEEMGIKGIHFQSSKQLREDLVKMGVL
jgi:2-haloacid dehalogenase